MKRVLKFAISVALLVAGLCGCEKLIPEIDLAGNLEGDWERVNPDGIQDAGLVIWRFTAGNEDPHSWVLSIYVSDVFAGDSEAKYIYQKHQNGYPGVGSSTPELYLYESDHDFMQEDGKASCTPAARYYVKECTKDKLVLQRIEVNVDGANMLEGDVVFSEIVYAK
ncbi:MAG: hypothetical protein IJ721_00975 [Bacteroidales bacterium]|nr:hypothetical protein [Bacteroidales bacterium]